MDGSTSASRKEKQICSEGKRLTVKKNNTTTDYLEFETPPYRHGSSIAQTDCVNHTRLRDVWLTRTSSRKSRNHTSDS